MITYTSYRFCAYSLKHFTKLSAVTPGVAGGLRLAVQEPEYLLATEAAMVRPSYYLPLPKGAKRLSQSGCLPPVSWIHPLIASSCIPMILTW